MGTTGAQVNGTLCNGGGGTGCFIELVWDPVSNAVIAIGAGWNNSNTIVSISPGTGHVKGLASFSQVCRTAQMVNVTVITKCIDTSRNRNRHVDYLQSTGLMPAPVPVVRKEENECCAHAGICPRSPTRAR